MIRATKRPMTRYLPGLVLGLGLLAGAVAPAGMAQAAGPCAEPSGQCSGGGLVSFPSPAPAPNPIQPDGGGTIQNPSPPTTVGGGAGGIQNPQPPQTTAGGSTPATGGCQASPSGCGGSGNQIPTPVQTTGGCQASPAGCGGTANQQQQQGTTTVAPQNQPAQPAPPANNPPADSCQAAIANGQWVPSDAGRAGLHLMDLASGVAHDPSNTVYNGQTTLTVEPAQVPAGGGVILSGTYWGFARGDLVNIFVAGSSPMKIDDPNQHGPGGELIQPKGGGSTDQVLLGDDPAPDLGSQTTYRYCSQWVTTWNSTGYNSTDDVSSLQTWNPSDSNQVAYLVDINMSEGPHYVCVWDVVQAQGTCVPLMVTGQLISAQAPVSLADPNAGANPQNPGNVPQGKPTGIAGHYKCLSEALNGGAPQQPCPGGGTTLLLNNDGTYVWGPENGKYTYDGTNVTFSAGLGAGTVTGLLLTVDSQTTDPTTGAGMTVKYRYTRLDY